MEFQDLYTMLYKILRIHPNVRLWRTAIKEKDCNYCYCLGCDYLDSERTMCSFSEDLIKYPIACSKESTKCWMSKYRYYPKNVAKEIQDNSI